MFLDHAAAVSGFSRRLRGADGATHRGAPIGHDYGARRPSISHAPQRPGTDKQASEHRIVGHSAACRLAAKVFGAPLFARHGDGRHGMPGGAPAAPCHDRASTRPPSGGPPRRRWILRDGNFLAIPAPTRRSSRRSPPWRPAMSRDGVDPINPRRRRAGCCSGLARPGGRRAAGRCRGAAGTGRGPPRMHIAHASIAPRARWPSRRAFRVWSHTQG